MSSGVLHIIISYIHLPSRRDDNGQKMSDLELQIINIIVFFPHTRLLSLLL